MIVSAWSAWSLVITRRSSMTDDDRALMTLDDVADYGRASVATVRYWIARGRLRSARPGRSQLVRREDLLRFLDSERASRVTPISISHDRPKGAWPKRATPVRAALVAELARSRRAPWAIASGTDSHRLHKWGPAWSPATCCAGTRRRLAAVQTSRRPELVSPTMFGQGTEPVRVPRRDAP